MTDTVKIISQSLGADSVLSGNKLYKIINGKWIGKDYKQVKPNGKGFQLKWVEDILITDQITGEELNIQL